jgi:tetratricopeptide (TPR) repeat protein
VLPEAASEQLAEARLAVAAALGGESLDVGKLGGLYGGLGRLYHAYRVFQAAEPAYANAAALAPEDPAWPYYQGHVYRELGRPAESAAAFERALGLRPDDLPTLAWLAEGALDGARPEEAAPYVQRAQALAPEDPMVLFLAGRLKVAMGEHQAAVELFTRAKAQAPTADAIDYPLGLAYRALGQMDRAEQFMAQRGNVRPGLADPLLEELRAVTTGSAVEVQRGLKALELGELRQAARHFRAAAEQDPDNVSAYINMAVVQVKVGRLEDAALTLQTILKRHPDNAAAQFNLGVVLARLGRNEEALAAYRQAVASDPSHVEAHFNLANALARVGQPAEAAEQYDKVVALDPGNERAHLRRGQTLLEAGRWADAVAALAASHKALPANGDLTALLVRALAAVPDPDVRDPAAAVELGQALVARDNGVEPIRALALALASAGRAPEAVGLLDQAIAAAREAGITGLAAELAAERAHYADGGTPRGPLDPLAVP